MKFVPAVSLVLGLMSAQVFADCSLGDAPTVPDGASSSLEVMLAAKKDVDAYMATSNAYLECLAKDADAKAEGLEEEAAAALKDETAGMHNAAVEAQEKLAAAFNQAIRDYKAANPN